jgi:uncharacterized protein (TIRG00374 family)
LKKWNVILPICVLTVVVIIFIVKRDELGSFVETVQNVQMLPFVLAVCCLFGRYFSHAYAYKAVYHCVDEDVQYLHIVPLVFSVTFANDCAPTAGMAGSALIAAWSHKQGLNMGKSVTVVFLEKIGFYGGFAIVMLVGFIILIATGQMSIYLALGGVIVLLMIFSFAFVMWLGYGHLETERKLFSWIERVVNKVLTVFHRKPMDPWADRIANSFHEASTIAVRKPRMLVTMFARMFLLHACDCCCFICSGFAFGFTNVPLLMASYVAGFIIATFILQTIGAVEVLLGLILAAYGATATQAAAIAVCYRGLIFWVPFIIGAICINITGTQKSLLKGSGSKDALVQAEQQAQAEWLGNVENEKAPAEPAAAASRADKAPPGSASSQDKGRAAETASPPGQKSDIPEDSREPGVSNE